MARYLLVVALSALLPGTVFAADPATSPTPPVPPASKPVHDGDPSAKESRSKDNDRKDGDRKDDDDRKDGDHRSLSSLQDREMSEKMKTKLRKMNPEERQHFLDNWERWKKMGDSEKQDWQKRAMDERDRVKRLTDDAIAKLGLSLDRDQKEVFALRYHQERRKIEQQLCTEMNDKRKMMTDEMLQRLKAEFSTPAAAATPSPTPAE